MPYSFIEDLIISIIEVFKKHGIIAGLYQNFFVMWGVFYMCWWIFLVIVTIIFDFEYLFRVTPLFYTKFYKSIIANQTYKNCKVFLRRYIKRGHFTIYFNDYAVLFSLLFSLFFWFILPYNVKTNSFNTEILFSILMHVIIALFAQNVIASYLALKYNKFSNTRWSFLFSNNYFYIISFLMIVVYLILVIYTNLIILKVLFKLAMITFFTLRLKYFASNELTKKWIKISLIILCSFELYYLISIIKLK